MLRGRRRILSTTASISSQFFDLDLTGLKDDQKITFDIEAGRDGRESAINLTLAD